MGDGRRLLRSWCVLLVCAVLTACATHPPAPVVERSSRPPAAEIPVDGLYRVQRGDTLYGIAFKYDLDFRDLARWNDISSPYTIYPDQVVRLRRPPGAATAGVSTAGIRSPSSRSTTTTRPASTTAGSPATSPPPQVASQPAPKPAGSSSPPPLKPAPPAATRPAASGGKGWIWPADGRLLRSFKAGDPTRNGIDIAATEGAPVRAAGGGEVVYSGNGLIGYGELVIVKHDERMLSAYAHNRRRLVAEGERVSQGQKIAEVGRNGQSESVLHFEIRRDGKPVDPLQFLPSR
ncbi:MAG: peptidoglycan DD-metalloendopeptidase family protein [Xanthomonadales bacterium]|nr:peptidoglycan DD-metalloendopeptidase family protein [Xanthomonadales bacterium]